MKYILAATMLLASFNLLAQPFPPRVPGPVIISQPGGTGSGSGSGVSASEVTNIVTALLPGGNGSGSVISNLVGLTFTVNAYNSNTTPYYLYVTASVRATPNGNSFAGGALYISTNNDATWDSTDHQYFFSGNASDTGDNTGGELSAWIPPGGKFLYTNLSGGSGVFAVLASSGQLTYFATNGGGTFNGNSASSTTAGIATNYGTAEILFNPPHFGITKTTGRYQGNNSQGLSLFASNGCVRYVWIVPDVGGNHQIDTNIWLQVYADCGTSTNILAPGGTQTINIPLSELFGNKFRFATNGPYSVIRDSRYLYSMDLSTNVLFGSYVRTVQLGLPMLFANNMLLRLTNASAGYLCSNGYFGISYDEGGPLAQFGTYANWRLRNQRFSGATVGGTSNFYFSVSTEGIIAGLLQSAYDSQARISDLVDSHGPRFYNTTSKTFWESTGGDDLYMNTYAIVGGQFIGFNVGTINWWYGPNTDLSQAAMETYRWFSQDAFIWPSSGVIVSDPVPVDFDNLNLNMLYYAP